jgi:hypothetical protein
MFLLDAAADVAGAVLTACFALVPSLPLTLVLTSLLAGVVIAPLTLRAFRASRALGALRPELERIRRAHADDPAAQHAATMEVFRSAGASPLTPLWIGLLQAPIAMAVYRAARGIAHRTAGAADPVHVSGPLAEAIRAGATKVAGVDLTRSGWAALHTTPLAALVVAAFVLVTAAVALAQRHAHRRATGPTTAPENPMLRLATRTAPVVAVAWGLVVPLSIAVSLTTMAAVRAATIWLIERRPPTA